MISYRKVADLTVVPATTAYEVRRSDGQRARYPRTTIGYVRRSQDGPGWAYALDLGGPWTRVPHSTRHQAADHLLSACSPMAAWLL
jgi:hypothetical protein